MAQQPFNVIQNLLSLPSSGDLSASQYCFAYVNTSGLVAIAGAGSTALGVLQNKPSASGLGADIQTGGATPIVCAGSITAGTAVKSDASGKAVAASSGDKALGLALQDGANGTTITMLFQPHVMA